MIFFDLSSYPVVVITFAHSEWSQEMFDQKTADLRDILKFGSEQKRVRLLVQGNPDLATSPPPLRVWGWIASALISLKPEIASGLERTAIYKPDSYLDKAIALIFKLYKPQRPLEMFNDIEEAHKYLQQ